MKKILTICICLISFNSLAIDKFLNKINTDIDNTLLAINMVNQNNKQLKKIILHWKKVESSYILQDLNEDYFDNPRFIDIFHGNNENLIEKLNIVINSKDSADIAMYKNSYKTINALEYMFSIKNRTTREKQIINIILKNLNYQLLKIKNGYNKYQLNFKEKDNIQAYLLSRLASETYKLKEWRIGDVVGLSKKYKISNNHRAEYFLSKNSSLAIKSILENQLHIIDLVFKNIVKINKEIERAKNIINKMLLIINSINDDDIASHPQLYNLGSKLLKTYHISIIDKLDYARKILDADGD